MKVLFLTPPDFLRPWYNDFLCAIGGRHRVILFKSNGQTLAQMEDIDVIVDNSGGMFLTHNLVDHAAAAGVRLLQILGTGTDHVDLDYIRSKRLLMANTPGQFSAVAVAEHALFLMLNFAKNFSMSQRTVCHWTRGPLINHELNGHVLGLLGFGSSSRALAHYAIALGMKIMAIDVIKPPKKVLTEIPLEFFGPPADLDRLLVDADYLSLHMPLTTATRRMIDRRALSLMKPSAVLINTARGELIDEPALIEALSEHRIKGAGLDVLTHEPPDSTSLIFTLDNIVVTQHIAGGTTGVSNRRTAAAAKNIDRLSQGLSPLYLVCNG